MPRLLHDEIHNAAVYLAFHGTRSPFFGNNLHSDHGCGVGTIEVAGRKAAILGRDCFNDVKPILRGNPTCVNSGLVDRSSHLVPEGRRCSLHSRNTDKRHRHVLLIPSV
jgi:hypothetical protein